MAECGIDRVVSDWISANIGPVRSIERHQRWRPAWFVTAERDGREIGLYVRGDREGFGFAGVKVEAQIYRVLEEHQISVPHVYGEIDEASAIVLDLLPGAPNPCQANDPAEVDAVMDSYVDALVRTHAIEPAAFAGLAVPDGPRALALDNFETFVARYREFKQRPEPLLEFAIGWLRRNAPAHRSAASFVLGDTGQYMYADGRITGLIDVELAHIGDVAHDLAGLRLRNATEPMGDLGRVLRRYQQVSGTPLDRAAIEFHTAKFALCTPLGITIVLHLDLPLTDIVQYIEWFHQLSLHAIESIARQAGVELSAVSLPEPQPTPYPGAVAGLASMVESLQVPAGIAEYERSSVARVARFSHRVAEYARAVEAADLDDLADLLGTRPADRAAGDQALEEFIHTASPEHDAALITLLHRRVMRQLLMMEPLLTGGRIVHVMPLDELLG
ncbi:phosphotransferase [Mycolicibacterium thermoresistibile]|uniref:Putative aminoglycoside phosphotransferase n=2 Tax=Mycolicibacterium thermoresistibile TaxID=1797 RepID=G7CFT1_MYCT3|nr:phosphotransferase [Mycolicibacterium thermoresistibile]EHI13360.1 putative aminoglycoside phosphotransferase [Mycolicibacterium thermoresistibile ATCC 19527]MCV7189153.1 phosphotransferase [Mycolicibacterium thermoresistibile]GAT14657.1 putative aminoglycoside phosphotransferase [Mycolicibacterium thermoresistibile]SNW19884.1 putative aminoglycoside phosphotransferase [Mycolicibacterium thermoresistibile]